MYEYRAKILNVLSADTLKLNIALGFGSHVNVVIQLSRVEAFELDSEDKKTSLKAEKARGFVEDLLHPVNFVVVKTMKGLRQDPNQYVGEVFVPTTSETVNLSDFLLEKGHVKEFKT